MSFLTRYMSAFLHNTTAPGRIFLRATAFGPSVRFGSTGSRANLVGLETLRFLNEEMRKERDRWHERMMKERGEWEVKAFEYGSTIGGLKTEALYIMDEKLRFQNNFNVRGAIERIAYHAVLEGKVPKSGGVQEKLNQLSQSPEFALILEAEVTKRKLVLKDVKMCVPNVYHELSKHAHGNSDTIELNHRHYTSNELAALISFFKLEMFLRDGWWWIPGTPARDNTMKNNLRIMFFSIAIDKKSPGADSANLGVF